MHDALVKNMIGSSISVVCGDAFLDFFFTAATYLHTSRSVILWPGGEIKLYAALAVAA